SNCVISTNQLVDSTKRGNNVVDWTTQLTWINTANAKCEAFGISIETYSRCQLSGCCCVHFKEGYVQNDQRHFANLDQAGYTSAAGSDDLRFGYVVVDVREESISVYRSQLSQGTSRAATACGSALGTDFTDTGIDQAVVGHLNIHAAIVHEDVGC